MGGTGKVKGWWRKEEGEEEGERGRGGGFNHHYSRLKMVTPERLTIPVPVVQGREETTGYHFTEPTEKHLSYLTGRKLMQEDDDLIVSLYYSILQIC